MKRKQIKIGLFGYGVVGQGLYEAIHQTPTLNAEISKICIKHADKKRNLPISFFTTEADELIYNSEINTIVELIDDSEAAFQIVKKSLIAGKSVVSANKKMIAEHFDELLELQTQTGSSLLYEAACCASIPIIRNLEEYYDNDLLEHVEGIVNGSTNYILSQIDSYQISPEIALKKAQELGFAESNPIMDTGGFDAKFKLILLIGHAFGVVIKPEDVFHLGIDRLGDLDLQYAKEKQFKIKLIAVATRLKSGEIGALVLPKFVEDSDPIYAVNDVFNGIKTKSFFSDYQFFVGKGAGAYPTASAVISDISALSYDYKYEYKKLRNIAQNASGITEDIHFKVLFRFPSNTEISVDSYFQNTQERLTRESSSYIIGNIRLERLKSLISVFGESCSVVLFNRIEADVQN